MRSHPLLRALLILSLMLIVLTGLGACAGAPVAPAPAQEGQVEGEAAAPAAAAEVTVNFAFHGGPEEVDLYQETVDRFMEEVPNITVNLQHIPVADYKRKVETMIAGGTPPDVFWLHATWFPKFQEAGELMDLTPFIEETGFPIDDYYESAVDQFSADGEILAIPRETSSIVLFYNKNMFDAAGVDYPTEDWTYDDVLAAAKALAKPDELQWGIAAPTAWHLLQPVIWSFGGEVLNQPENTRCMMTKPETVEAIQWVADLIHVHQVAPSAADLAGQAATDLFVSNKLGMFWSGRWDVAAIRRAEPDFNFDIQHMPTGPGGKVTRISSGAYAITTGSKNPEAAWKLVEYLTSSLVYDFFAEGGLIIPAYIPSAQSEAMLDPSVPPEHSQIFLDALEYGKGEPITTIYPEMLDIIQPEIEAVMLGDITAQEAADAICPKLDEVLAKK